jgi:hypothetical protein
MVDPLNVAAEGYLNSQGERSVLSIAVNGYLLTITKDEDGGFTIKPRPRGKKPPVLQGGGPGPVIGDKEPYSPDYIIEEDEEIITIIRIFLHYESKGLFS